MHTEDYPPDDYPLQFDPNFLVDRLRQHVDAPDDESLAQYLNLPLSLLQDLRAGQVPVSASLVLMLQSATGITVDELRRTMGDRRSFFRVATLHPYME